MTGQLIILYQLLKNIKIINVFNIVKVVYILPHNTGDKMDNKNKNITIHFNNNGKNMMMFCTEKELDRILKKLKKNSQIKDIRVLK